MKLLVAKNKYETEYFRFTTRGECRSSILKLFKLNDELEHYFDIKDPDYQTETIEEVEYLHTEIDALKDIKFEGTKIRVEELRNRLSKSERFLAELRHQHGLYLEAKKGSVKAAFELLKLRKDYEYEQFEIVKIK